MQSLDIISVNLWQILISLCNLAILFFLLKKFLYKPVTKMMAARKQEVERDYDEAAQYKAAAESDRAAWEEKLSDAKSKAESIVKGAAVTAERRGDKIVSDAKEHADSIVRQAQTLAALEKKKAQAEIKDEIVDVSTALTEKLLGREMNEKDHRDMIDSFIEEIGDGDDANS